jgi:hypothetical protein
MQQGDGLSLPQRAAGGAGHERVTAKRPPKEAPAEAGAWDRAGEADFSLADAYLGFIEMRKADIEAGDGEALLYALWDSCYSGVAMPYWLSVHVVQALRRYKEMHARTLDDAFGLEARKSFTKRSKRTRYRRKIYMEVCALHSVGVPISKELYKAVAELYSDFKDGKIVEEVYSSEFKRLGRRISNTDGLPERLPEYLKPLYESMTGKRAKKRV